MLEEAGGCCGRGLVARGCGGGFEVRRGACVGEDVGGALKVPAVPGWWQRSGGVSGAGCCCSPSCQGQPHPYPCPG